MLYAYIGTNREKARDLLWRAARAEAKKCGANVELVAEGDGAVDELRRSLAGGSLFSESRVVVFDGLLSIDETRDILLDNLKHLSKSRDHFFVFEEKVNAEGKRALKSNAETLEEFTAPKKEEGNDVFALANALGRRDKKMIWVSYIRALQSGAAPEALHGMLFWKAKDLMLKNSRAPFNQEELRRLISELAELPHESRRRGIELSVALERFLLSV